MVPVARSCSGPCLSSYRLRFIFAVSHHYIVGDEDRDLLAVDGVDRLESLDLKAGLILDQLCSLKLGLLGALVSVSVDGVHIGNAVLILVDHGMRIDRNICNLFPIERRTYVKRPLKRKSPVLKIHIIDQRLSEITRADQDHIMLLIQTKDLADLFIKITGVVSVPLLAEAAEIVEVLP